MDSNQNELDYLAEQTLAFTESLKSKSFLKEQVFDEDLVEFEKLKEAFQFAPVENCQNDQEVEAATLEEVDSICQGVLGNFDFSIDPEELQKERELGFSHSEAVIKADEVEIVQEDEGFFFDFDMPELDAPYQEVQEEFQQDTIILPPVFKEATLETSEDELEIEVELELSDEPIYPPVISRIQPEEEIETIEEVPQSDFSFDFEREQSASGIIYNVVKGASTFTVKAIATEDLDSFELTEDVIEDLKLTEDSDPSFFPTTSYERAEIIKDQIANRRFTVHEDMICNIGDPGFSWWFEKRDRGFSIYFKSYKVNRVEEALRLGPMGDVHVALHRFPLLESFLRELMPLSEFSCDENALSISTSMEENETLEKLIKLFETGENFFMDEDFPLTREGRMLSLYLNEIADIRSWWLEIDREVHPREH